MKQIVNYYTIIALYFEACVARYHLISIPQAICVSGRCCLIKRNTPHMQRFDW